MKEVRLDAPLDNLCTAIGILQAEILAGDTACNPEVMFGTGHFKSVGLELVVALLEALVADVEPLKWPGEEMQGS